MNHRRITVAEMAPHVHSFGLNENKVDKISAWLSQWIKNGLKQGNIKPYDLLPSKGDLAFHIGVSQGTMQNVFRNIEDLGLVESKQRIGTYVKNPNADGDLEKLTSKREMAIEIIKRYLLDNDCRIGDCLISARKLSRITGISNATIRMAVNCLVAEKIVKKVNNTFIVTSLDFGCKKIETQTLVDKVAESLRVYVKQNFRVGDKLPANSDLANMFSVSIKTIHDAIKILAKDGLVYSRRGRYGTIVADAGEENPLYDYEKIELKIRNYIAQNCEIGMKLPPITELADIFKVSPKTIKKSLDNLADDGYLTFTRGRYGGTFVTDIPQNVNESYKWLAISADYVANT